MEKSMRIEYAGWLAKKLQPYCDHEQSYMFTGTFKNYRHADGSVKPPSFSKARGRADALNDELRALEMRALTTVELGTLVHARETWTEDGKSFAMPGDVGRYHVHSVFTGRGLAWLEDGSVFGEDIVSHLRRDWEKLGWCDLRLVDSAAAVAYATKYVLKSDSWRYWTI